MKKSNRTVRKMRSAWTGFAAACLAAALTMSALVSCAPQESRPVVTSDDLTPPSAAQEAIAQEAGGGKNYAYYWQAENAEETLQMLREAYEQEVNDAKELIAKGEEAVKAAGYPSLAEAQQAVEARQARIEQDLADNQKRLEAELALDPVVSAQEAANLAGSLFEKLYGFDLSELCRDSGEAETAGKGTTFRQCARRRRGSDGGPCGAGRKDRGKRREPHQPVGRLRQRENLSALPGILPSAIRQL